MGESIREVFKTSVLKYKNLEALSIIDAAPLSYENLYCQVKKEALKLKSLGIKSGDKIAILSTNSPNWGISYLSIIFVGAIVVPILHDFSKKEIQNILNHSESKAIFVSSGLKSKLSDIGFEYLQFIIDIENFKIDEDLSPSRSVEKDLIEQDLQSNENLEQIFGAIESNSTATIIYTSGTTGLSKGVMLSHENLLSNIEATYHVQKILPGDRFLSILPLSHTYECTLGFLMALLNGATIYYLKGAPTASILLPALKKVKPTMMLSVPLVIEKIYKSNIKPKLTKGFLKYLYKFGPFRKLLNRFAGKKLLETFGGKLHFFGIGGARLEAETERFLIEARFPYAIGYGLTETSPLLTAAVPGKTKHCSAGFSLPGQSLKLINVNKDTGEGEIIAFGLNIMQGYYKNEELTQTAFTKDGWFKTGDLGVFDNENRLYIKGRLKNLILGANGENIYPEEIEAVLNQHRYVLEAIVYEFKGKVVAKVHLDYVELEKHVEHLKESAKHIQHDMHQHIHKTLEDIKMFVNSEVKSFSKIAHILEQPSPFEKTPTLKIKKYLYI